MLEAAPRTPIRQRQGAAAVPSDTAHRAPTPSEVREKGVKKRAMIRKFREQTALSNAKAFGMSVVQT